MENERQEKNKGGESNRKNTELNNDYIKTNIISYTIKHKMQSS